jgi:multidrug efflux pump subunit AcrB
MWGLAVATVMTLFVIPLVYRAGMTRSQRRKATAS